MDIYVFCNTADCEGTDWHSFLAMCEDGHILAAHICSHHSYAAHDMGVAEDGWNRDLYAEHCPDGFRVLLVEASDPRVQAAYALNQKLAPVVESD